MLFDKRKKKKSQKRRDSYRGTLGEKLYKFIFFAGLALAFKGLRGWLRSKKRKMSH